jgi:AcrR family transcriptional regulator
MSAASPTPQARTRGSVSREQIAREALAILDADGLDSLTMRRLADAVGVGTMTVYGHFRNKEEVLDAAVDVASAPVEFVLSGDWRNQLRSVITTAWEALEAHPALVHLRLVRPVVRPEALRFAEAVMAILQRAGVSSPEAATIFRMLFTYTIGYTALQPQQRAAEARRETDVAIAGLSAETHPRLRAARGELVASAAGRETFEAGLEVILDGVESRVHAAGAAR